MDDEVLNRYLQNTAEKAKLRRMSSLGLDGDASIEKYTNELDNGPDIVSFPALSPLMHGPSCESKTDMEQNSNIVDHRLQPSFSFGDETIQKRLERAMNINTSSPNNISGPVEECKNDDHIQNVESTDHDLITMVENFSFHDDSSLEESNAMESHFSSPVFKNNDTLHVSAEKEESIASSNTGQNLQDEIPFDSSWHSSHTSLEKCEATKKEKQSFDSDCSYKPDENFEAIEWDDSD